MLGLYWVSDLAVEGDVEVKGDQGELLLLLVKGGITLHVSHRRRDRQGDALHRRRQGRVCRE